MKKIFLLTACLIACLALNAQDTKVAIASAIATSSQSGEEESKAIDGNLSTFWHSQWGSGAVFNSVESVEFTITLKEVSLVDYVRYIPRQNSNQGHWGEVEVSYSSSLSGGSFTSVGTFNLGKMGLASDLSLNGAKQCGQIKLTIRSGNNNHATAAEIEAYKINNDKGEVFAEYFDDPLYTTLKSGIDINNITDADVEALVASLQGGADAYKKFRVGEYEPYMTLASVQERLGTVSQYSRYENPTGIYFSKDDTYWVAVSGIENSPVYLTVKNWVENEDCRSYPLRNGLNCIKSDTEGNVFVSYYTDDPEAENVEVHFINAPVLGYWDKETMTNDDWKALLAGKSKDDNTILMVQSEHVQLAYPISAWLAYCPEKVSELMELYEKVQWAERDILGLKLFKKEVKNRQLYYATTYGFMAATGEGGYCNVNSLKAIMTPDVDMFDSWGVGHEWGHNNQIVGFHWSGCGEATNNIYASWAQLHFKENPSYLRLEDEEMTGGKFLMRGGRMQAYFEEALLNKVCWQLQEGQDNYKETPKEVTVMGQDADGNNTVNVTTTKRNYDHFVKLVPFWQLNLWGTMAKKSENIIPKVIESIRTTDNYTSTYNTNGKQQINWMKLACDNSGLNLLPFFEKAGMLRPINAYIEDYSAGWNIITEAMINELKSYVATKGYPTPTEEINYINGHNYLTYKEKKALSVPETMGEGCVKSDIFVKVQHSVVQNAVAFETYNDNRELVRITMYGLGSDDHSFTQVLFPSEGDYIQAVGYDGTRKTIYSRSSIVWSLNDLSNNKCYTVATKDRGAWYSEDNQLTSTGKFTDVNYNEEDANQQFAFLKSEKGNYYLYSVAKKKFVQVSEPDKNNNNTYTTLSDEPKHAVTFHSSTGGDKADCPWVVALGGKHVGISNGYTPGVITFYNDLADGGNMVSIKAAASFDPTDALAKIKAYEESAKFNELQALISKYEEEVSKANIGVGRLTNSAATTISAAIAEAKKITGANSDEEIESAIETLNSAFENVEIVLPSEGKFYRMTNHFVNNNVMYVNGDNGLAHKSGTISDASDVFQFIPTTGGYYLYNVARGTYLSTAKGHGAGQNYSEEASVENATVLAISSFNDGTVPQVSLTPAEGATLHADTNYGTVVGWNASSNSKSAWYVSEVSAAEVKHTLTVSAARWSSLVLGFNATIPSGVTAYVVSSYVVPETIAGEATITPISGNVLPANTPVLINAAEGNYDFAYTTATATVGNNLLEGKPYNTYLTTVAGTTNYVLSYEGENVSTIGLYKKTVYDADRSDDDEEKDDEGKVITPVNDHIAFFANKAYLPVTTSNGAAPMLRITRGDDATGIQDAELTIDNGQLTIYDITGRRVEKMEKGIYIVNGRKVVIK